MPNKKPPARVNQAEPHDPYKLRTLEQITAVMDRGAFPDTIQERLVALLDDLANHRDVHPGIAAKGSLTLTLNFEVKTNGDTVLSGACNINRPKAPPATGAAFLGDSGELSLGSPMMRRMDQPVRDVTNYDPETGEIRDAD